MPTIKSTHIVSLPYYFILYIDNTVTEKRNVDPMKLEQLIEFPDCNGNGKYELYARSVGKMIYKEGAENNVSYHCYCAIKFEDEWLTINNHEVSKTTFEEIESTHEFMVIYRRIV